MEDVKEAILRELFDRLNSDNKSALKGKLSPSNSAPNKISRVAFNRALAGPLDTAILRALKPSDGYVLVRNYINAFDAEMLKTSNLTRAAYFEAMFDVFDEAVRSTRNKLGNLKQESIQETIRPIARLEFEGQGLTRKELVRLMQEAIRKDALVTADML